MRTTLLVSTLRRVDAQRSDSATSACAYCGQTEGHSLRCAITRLGADEMPIKALDDAAQEIARLRNVIVTGGAAYRAERAALGAAGGDDPGSETATCTCDCRLCNAGRHPCGSPECSASPTGGEDT